MCKSHVKRNTEELREELGPHVAKDGDGSLKACGVDPVQAVADVERLGKRMVSRKPKEDAAWQEMHLR